MTPVQLASQGGARSGSGGAPKPGAEPEGRSRFTLAQNPGTEAAPAYTLCITEGVKTITPGEFAADPSTTTNTAKTRLTVALLGANPTSKVTAIELPDSLVRIENDAFAEHKKVSGELTIPPTVEHIGPGVFYRLSSGSDSSEEFVHLNFAPNSKLKFIGNRAFNFARLRAFPRLPRSLQTVEDDAFYLAEYPKLSNFVIPENVSKLGRRAFGTSGGFEGTLTIESPNFRRTPPLSTSGESPPKTGRLGDSIFARFSAAGTAPSLFTSIILHKTVFDSYSQTDLNTIFGTGGSYVDFADKTTPLTK